MAIQFLKGRSSIYFAPGFTPVEDVFYYLTDTQDFYLGTNKLTSAKDVATAVANIAQNAADIVELNTKLAKVNQDLAKKVERSIAGVNGTALVFNESDGGGAKFEHQDGTWSFVGVNDGGQNGITGQLYSVMRENGVSTGTRLNMTTDGFYYTNGKSNASYEALDEIATKRDVADASGSAVSKTIYLKDTTTIGGQYAREYSLYQGADAVDMSQNVFVGSITVDKDKFLQHTSIVTVQNHVDSEGDPADVADGTYIKMVMQNQDEALYLDVTTLIEDFTVQPNATQIQLALSANRELSATIVAGSVGTTELANNAVTEDKLSQSLRNTIANKTDYIINGTNGRSLMFNESDGGGAKFEHQDNTNSFVGVNDGGANGLSAQIYSVDKTTNTGSRINVTSSGIYYTSGKANASYDNDDEIATKGYVDTQIIDNQLVWGEFN